MLISNYELTDQIAEAPQAAVYKARHKRDPERLLVLKVWKTASLSEYTQAQFRQKIEHLKVLNDPLLITPLSLGVKDGACFVTQDFFDGVPLNKLTEGNTRLSLNDFFTIACRLTKALDTVHEAGIIHGGIKPNNILVNHSTLDVRLIDFISTINVRDVSHFIYNRAFVRDTLAYTSPEQTGRINHRVVFSSDLYSLGIVFYELLTGQLPFSSDDPLELIHAHLAREAPKAHIVNRNVPVALSNIVAKLLLKQPEKRYQTGRGLLADLVRCRDEFSAIVRYVHRTGECVMLDTAAQQGSFKDNMEVQALQLRSVLCLPLARQAQTVGMLYLGNRLSDGVFTAQKTQMTELLMLQAAILLENARLAEELKRFEPSMV